VSPAADYTQVMKPPVNYDVVAPAYDQRYERHRFDGIDAAVRHFIGPSRSVDVAEVGCGTGHWLAQLRDARTLAGLDVSPNMLRRARAAVPSALLVRGRAESLPWTGGVFDRLLCINALHHFDDASAFMREARRVLRPGGGILTVGREPPALRDAWWIYTYFPEALAADRERYLPTATIREHLQAVGFTRTATEIAQHISAEIPFTSAADRGLLDRRSTSQLMVISDDAYEAGLKRLRAEQPMLMVDIRLYATAGWAP
jgi:ubiquinone/menaquinone biosynthesis C-methylase UbiE